MIKKILFFAVMSIIFTAIHIQAAPWDSTPYTHEQTDGTIISVRKLGDEFFHWYEDTSGNILAWNNGDYFHALIENGRLTASEYAAGILLPPNFIFLTFEDLLPLIDAVDRDIFQRGEIFSEAVNPMSQNLTFPIQTGFDLLTVLIDFDGTPHPEIPLPLEGTPTLPWGTDNDSAIYTQRQRAYFDTTPGEFTVVNFFEDMSGGQGIYKPLQTVGRVGSGTRRTIRTGSWIGHSLFQNKDIDVTVFPSLQDGVVRVRIHLAHPIERWEGDSDQTFFRSRAMTTLALHTIHNHYIPLNARRNDGSQQIHFSICMATNPGNVGGYQGNFTGAAIGFAGGNIRYGMYNSGHANAGTGTNLGIGVAVHELGHVLGLPDFYSYRTHPDWQSSTGLGWFCVMGLGAGQPPAPFSAWARVLLGYVQPEVICASEGGTAEIRRWELNNRDSFNVLRVNSPECPHQFFLLENRQRNIGWDTNRIGTNSASGGITIYHVDPFAARPPANSRFHTVDYAPFVNFPDGSVRNIGGAVDYTPHPQVRVVLANNDILPNQAGDHFFHAGTANRNRFSPTTAPNSNFYPIEWHSTGRRIANGNRYRTSGIDIEILDPRQATMRIQINPLVPTVSEINLSYSGTLDFGNAETGYSEIPERNIIITNTGNTETGTLSVAISGENADSFTLSRNSIENIKPNEQQTFTVQPNTGLSVGEYNATITVSSRDGNPIITQLTNNATVTTSGTASWENHNRVQETTLPTSSSPGTGQGWGTWGQQRTGLSESESAFLCYEWTKPVTINRAEIYWYDDNGGTRVPIATGWAIQYSENGTDWQNVQLTGDTNYDNGRILNTFNRFSFEAVEARYLRVYIWGVTPSGAGTGILRFRALHDALSQSFNVSFTVNDLSTHTVTFLIPTENGFLSQEYKVVNNAAIGEVPAARRSGYRFVGWYDAPTGGTRIHADTPVTASKELHARWVNFENFRIGDADADTRITSADAIHISRWILSGAIVLNENSPQNIFSADLNGDAYVNISDITLFARWLVGQNVLEFIVN